MADSYTLPQLLKINSERYGTKKLAMRKKDLGIWNKYSWQDYYYHAKCFSLGLLSLGLKPGDKVAIIGESDPQWFWAELASQAAGGIAVGIFQDCTVPEVKYIAEHSDARFIVARDQEQVDKILSAKDELPNLEKVIYWDSKGLWSYGEPLLISFSEVEELGREYEKTHLNLFEEMIEDVKAEQPAVFCYTSGTTALPKGAMISHNGMLGYARAYSQVHNINDTDQWLSSMAPAWYPEQVHAVALPLLKGMVVNFSEAAETMAVDLREVGPHIWGGPPRIWENIASQIQARMIDASAIKRFTYHLFLPIGYKMDELFMEKKSPSLFWKLLAQMAYLTVLRPLKDKLGLSHVKFGLAAGGFSSPDMFKFVRALGVAITQQYALTEAGVGAYHWEDDVNHETVGRPAMGMQIRISDESEIALKGEQVFSGYYKDAESTREKLVNGWFSTGDAGFFNEEGHLIMWERVKDLMDLTDGAKFSPSYIESRLRFSPYIKEVISIGGKDKPFIAVIVDIDFENVSRWAEVHRIPYTTFVDLSQRAEVHELVQNAIQRVNRDLPEAAKVKRFVNLHKELDADEAEMTRTRKLRRSYMEDRYQNLISALYGDREEMEIEAEVKYRDGRMGTVKTAIKIKSVEG